MLRELEGRPKLIGLEIHDQNGSPSDGAIIYKGNTIMGHLCTCRKSVTLKRTIAMALVDETLFKTGQKVQIYQSEGQDEKRYTATVVPMPFYDSKGLRLKGAGEKQ